MKLCTHLAGLTSLSLLACSSASDENTVESMIEAWPQKCEALKAEISAEPGIDMLYTGRDAITEVDAAWNFEIDGIHIPIPPIEYTHVSAEQDGDVPIDQGGNIAFTLVGAGEGEQLMYFQVPMGPPMEDVFKMTGQASSPENIAFTHEIFGGPVPVSRLTEMGFQHRPADLSCAPESWKQEIPIGIALTLKSIARPPLISIHQGIGEEPGELKLLSRGWEADFFHGETWPRVVLFLPEDHSHRSLGLSIGTQVPEAPARPAWLDALQNAVRYPEDSSQWETLVSELEKAGMKEMGIETTRSNPPRFSTPPATE
jgi:hypothetical protein